MKAKPQDQIFSTYVALFQPISGLRNSGFWLEFCSYRRPKFRVFAFSLASSDDSFFPFLICP